MASATTNKSRREVLSVSKPSMLDKSSFRAIMMDLLDVVLDGDHAALFLFPHEQSGSITFRSVRPLPAGRILERGRTDWRSRLSATTGCVGREFLRSADRKGSKCDHCMKET